METAIKRTQELKSEFSDGDAPLDQNKIKVDINTLLHTYLPGETTIREAEILAYVILEILTCPEIFLNPQK